MEQIFFFDMIESKAKIKAKKEIIQAKTTEHERKSTVDLMALLMKQNYHLG